MDNKQDEWEIKELVRELLRSELRVRVETEHDGPVIDSVRVSLYLQEDCIASHVDYLGFPKKKEGGI